MKIQAFVAALSLVVMVGSSEALPPEGGLDFDCNYCKLETYPGLPGSYWKCYGSMGGSGSGCVGTRYGCTYTGGCVSLPRGLETNGLNL
jgi:hypothetical protein